ncbi:acyltransferase family protein [Lactiplantibacillus daowaiensis]|uniref:Acyltransferase family protein n=1 Tax=Lactiplantibacillus daowaiensis TaxID=2559918 RepID=A0ABW1RWF5_9LACO|nr:acyltransferase family protein [Lactiplantibacillus daowaiensis]
MAKRIEWIDFGKGLTMVLVVLGHVLLGLYGTGLYSNNQEYFMRYIMGILYSTHMPIFFAISGFVYSLRNNHLKAQELLVFNIRKLIGLGIPYVLFSIVYWGLKAVGKGTARVSIPFSSLLEIYKSPIEILWFLYTLFFVFLFVSVLDSLIINPNVVMLILIIGFLSVTFFPTNIVCIQQTFMWTLFFYFGKQLHLHFKLITSNMTRWLSGAFVVVFMIFRIFIPAKGITGVNYANLGIVQVLISLCIVVFAFSVFESQKTDTAFFKYFDKIGPITITIYLIHAPFESVFRILLLKFGIVNLGIQIALGLIVSFYFAIACDFIIERVSFLKFLFYPTKFLTAKRLNHFFFQK